MSRYLSRQAARVISRSVHTRGASSASGERTKLTAASGLYNVVRQVCGSIGIASAATMVSSGTTTYRAVLSEAITPADERVRTWLALTKAGLMRLGGDATFATQRALQLLDGYVTRQASVLAYNHIYQLITISFLACLPLVLLLKRPKGHVEVEIGVD